MKFIEPSIVSTMMLDAEIKQRGSNPNNGYYIMAYLPVITVHNLFSARIHLTLVMLSDKIRTCSQYGHLQSNISLDTRRLYWFVLAHFSSDDYIRVWWWSNIECMHHFTSMHINMWVFCKQHRHVLVKNLILLRDNDADAPNENYCCFDSVT